MGGDHAVHSARMRRDLSLLPEPVPAIVVTPYRAARPSVEKGRPPARGGPSRSQGGETDGRWIGPASDLGSDPRHMAILRRPLALGQEPQSGVARAGMTRPVAADGGGTLAPPVPPCHKI